MSMNLWFEHLTDFYDFLISLFENKSGLDNLKFVEMQKFKFIELCFSPLTKTIVHLFTNEHISICMSKFSCIFVLCGLRCARMCVAVRLSNRLVVGSRGG